MQSFWASDAKAALAISKTPEIGKVATPVALNKALISKKIESTLKIPEQAPRLNMIKCILVVIFGSMAHPLFLCTQEPLALPCNEVLSPISRAASLLRLPKIDLGLVVGTTFMAADFGVSRVFVQPRLNIGVSAQVAAKLEENNLFLLSWEDIRGTAVEIPCLAAHFIISSLVHIAPRQISSPSPSEVDWGPSVRWESLVDLSAQTDKTLIAA